MDMYSWTFKALYEKSIKERLATIYIYMGFGLWAALSTIPTLNCSSYRYYFLFFFFFLIITITQFSKFVRLIPKNYFSL